MPIVNDAPKEAEAINCFCGVPAVAILDRQAFCGSHFPAYKEYFRSYGHAEVVR
jgi:hypothetical protein